MNVNITVTMYNHVNCFSHDQVKTIVMAVDAAAITTNLVVKVVTADAAVMVAAANTIRIKVRKDQDMIKYIKYTQKKYVDMKNKIGQDVGISGAKNVTTYHCKNVTTYH